MAILFDKEAREALKAAKARVRELESPVREAAKIKAASARRKREKGLDREDGQRKPRVQEPGYLAFLRRQPCEARHLGGCCGRIDPAHLRFSDIGVGRINPGKGRKSDDRWALSLCRKHHDEQHAHGNERAWWESVVRRDPSALAIERHAAYRSVALPSHAATTPDEIPGMHPEIAEPK
jgi:hypothetical protein